MNVSTRIGLATTAVAMLIGCGQLTPTAALAELHNVNYIARIDGVAPGSQATFMINDTQTNTAPLSSVLGNAFQANAVLGGPGKAGMQVAIRWPYSAKVHCEIGVDDTVAAQVDQFVRPVQGSTDPMNGVLPCGAPLPAA